MTLYCCALMLLSGVAGWSGTTHEIVARMAAELLVPEAKSFLARTLGSDVADIAETMAEVSGWADGPARSEVPDSDPWHFFGAPDSFTAFNATMCTASDGQLVCALAAQIQSLVSPDAVAREQAAKFVIHLMADLHQPLQVGRRADRNANGIKTSVPETLRPKLNAKGWSTLHSMWDMLIPEYLFQVDASNDVPATRNIAMPKHVRFPQHSPSVMAEDFLLRLVPGDFELPLDEAKIQSMDALVSLFGEMAVELHRDFALPHAYRFVSNGATGELAEISAGKVKKIVALPASYVVENARRVPLLLSQAAVRLAQVLNLMAGVEAAASGRTASASAALPPLVFS